LSALAVFAVVAGLYLGASGPLSWRVMAACVFGTLLVAVSSNSLNMYLERDFDRAMPRTQHRPLPAGRLRPAQVLRFGVLCGVLGLVWLFVETNPLATGLCALILVSYVGVYTPLKRVTTLNTLVGAIPGALPPLVGYAAGHGALDARAAVLFLILFFWQIPHFLSIAWRYREDYRLGGMRMLPTVDPQGRLTAQQMVVYTTALVAASVFGYVVDLAGPLYLVAALFLGALFVTPVVMAAVLRRESAMRLCFFASILYLPMLLGVMVLDKSPV
jgi:protoheme IX farnesyltransferase